MIDQVASKILANWSSFICNQVKREWSNKNKIKGEAEIDFYLNNAVANVIVSTITASGAGAFIMEYGSGHLLDQNNPYLDSYKSTDRFNDNRTSEGYEFLGRSKGDTVYHPDGSTYQSEGRAEGLHLEREMNGRPPLEATLPMHIIEEQVKLALPEIIADLTIEINKDIVNQLTVNYQVKL